MGQRLEQHARAIGIVAERQDAARLGGLGDAGDVLDVEGQRARAFDIDHPGGVRRQGDHLVRRQFRVVVTRHDAEALHLGLDEAAHRRIGRIDDQDFIAGLEESEDRQGQGRQAGRQDKGLRRSLQVGDQPAELALCRQVVGAVGRLDRLVVEHGGVFEQDGRAALDTDIDGAARRRATKRRGIQAGDVFHDGSFGQQSFWPTFDRETPFGSSHKNYADR